MKNLKATLKRFLPQCVGLGAGGRGQATIANHLSSIIITIINDQLQEMPLRKFNDSITCPCVAPMLDSVLDNDINRLKRL